MGIRRGRRAVFTFILIWASCISAYLMPADAVPLPAGAIPLSARAIPVLMYHHVAPDPSRIGLGLRVRPADFDAQMGYLFQNGYRTVGLQDVVKAIHGCLDLPSKPIVITFDDGYEDVYRYAFPILRKYGYTATIFLISSWLDQPGKYGAMSWDQVKAMAREGMQFGAHTVSHPNLLKLPLRQVLEEMTESRAAIEAHVGQPVKALAYPYGLFNSDIKLLAQRAGYEAAVTTIQGYANDPVPDTMAIKRIRVMGTYSLDDFVRRLYYPVTLALSEEARPSLLPDSHSELILGSRLWRALESRLVSAFYPRIVVRGDPSRKLIALTFDDGPKAGITPWLLDILDEYGVRATFFVTGVMAERNPDLVREMAARGHVIGNHTYTHADLTGLTREGIFNELQNTRMVVRGITNRTVSLFRPPGGAVSRLVIETAARAGFTTVLWTINADDVALRDPAAIAGRVLKQAENGAIVLLHDGTSATIEALPAIIVGLRRMGYRLVTVDQMF